MAESALLDQVCPDVWDFPEIGVAGDEFGIRGLAKSTGCLDCIRGAQAVPGAELGRDFDDISVDLDYGQARMTEEAVEELPPLSVPAPDGLHAAFKKAER